MKPSYMVTLLTSMLLCTSAGAWQNVPSGPQTINIYQQQQPDYAANVSNGFKQLADALGQYEATRSSKPTPETIPAPVITYERQPDGSMAKCRTYGENSFCD